MTFKHLITEMACSVHRDANGTGWHIKASKSVVTKGGKKYEGCPEVQCWWDRDVTNKSDENLIIRQESVDGKSEADVIQITLGQAYDLLHAIALAIKTP